MDKMKISVLSGAALLGSTIAASAGPMSVTDSQSLRPQSEITPVAYHHYYRHYCHRYHHYAYWHRHHYHRYAYYRHRYYSGYGWNPVAAAAGTAVGLATLPFAWATGGYGYPYYGPSYYYY